jgi:HEPN domain-containing protein
MCSITYFRLAKHNLDAAKSSLRDYQYDELFLRDLTYNLQQCVEKTLKAFLECVGVTIPQTHKISRLIKMSKDNGSAVIITDWLSNYCERLETWEADARYDMEFYVELSVAEEALTEVEKFLELNGLMNEKDKEITDSIEEELRKLIPVDIKDNFELNVYYHVFKKKLKNCMQKDDVSLYKMKSFNDR